jgi:hypothetical protein
VIGPVGTVGVADNVRTVATGAIVSVGTEEM